MPTTRDRAASRWAALTVAVVASLLGVPAAVAAPAPARHPVLLVAVPDLRWTDLAAMPHLSALAARGAVGELSVRSEGEATRCGDALLELSAGTRVPNGVVSCGVDAATLSQLRTRYRHSRYGARVGLLGDSLARAGTTAASLGNAAAVVLSTADGPAPGRAGEPAGVTVVVDPSLYGSADRRADAGSVDAGVAGLLGVVSADTVVIVAGISDGPTGGPRLHPVVITGPGWRHRELTSASTGRAPYVQLFDLTATLLVSQGITDLPRTVSGRPVRPSSAHVRTMSTYADIDRHARRALHVGHPTFTVLSAVLIVVLLLLLVRPAAAAWPARLLVLAPLATWLVQLVPWWRASTWVYVALLAGISTVGALSTWFVARSSPRWALLLGPALTAGVLLVDQLADAPLQMSAPFGDNPLVAGRFHGMGNIDFGVAMAAVVLCLAVGATGRTRRAAATIVVAGGLVALVIDGAPSLGDDIGGILALVPALALLGALLGGVRLTIRRVLPMVVAAVVVAVGVALADYARPEDTRTHAGRFVEDVRNGDAWQTVHRKLDAVLSSFTNPIVSCLVLLAVIVAVGIARRGADSRPASFEGVPAAAVSVAVLAVIGAALNDSGVFVAAAALLAFAPAVVAAGRPRLDQGKPGLGDTRLL